MKWLLKVLQKVHSSHVVVEDQTTRGPVLKGKDVQKYVWCRLLVLGHILIRVLLFVCLFDSFFFSWNK